MSDVDDRGLPWPRRKDYEDARLGRRYLVEANDEVFTASNRYRTVCQQLDLAYGCVSPDDIVRATPTGDVYKQIRYLHTLFKTCAMRRGDLCDECGDLISAVLDYAPEDEGRPALASAESLTGSTPV